MVYVERRGDAMPCVALADKHTAARADKHNYGVGRARARAPARALLSNEDGTATSGTNKLDEGGACAGGRRDVRASAPVTRINVINYITIQCVAREQAVLTHKRL
ncbi:hypothetical protein EVAR_88381_1 [Eumeta japonica]|uniref:Uncharacterized protein n=1 Tax=Eumeta variegata TaxID=151549 RepID=A0A4C1XBS0_EUMVA|nr:hypothetical protein EVAR_88381_1 [Eumeta japonica]